MINLTVNGRAVSLDADPDMPLLWAVREELGYVNTYNSYIQFLIAVIFRVPLAEDVVNIGTAACFFAAVILSVLSNVGVILKKGN